MNESTPKNSGHPPDRSHVLTEQRNPRSMNLHQLSVVECVALLQREDHAVLWALEAAAPALTAFIEAVEPRFLAGGRLIYLGAGTSGRLGVLDASEAPPTFQIGSDRIIGLIAGGDVALRKSSESQEDDPAGAHPELEQLRLSEKDTLLGIAAGGTTPYVLGALEYAKRREPPDSSKKARLTQPRQTEMAASNGPLTGLLVCTPIEKPGFVDHLLVLGTGPEVLTGSTRMKAGTATKLALNTISTTLMVRAGRVYENLMIDLKATNNKLRDRAARIIATLTGLDRTACLAWLDRADGAVKTAILMQRHNLSRADAESALEKCGGRLDTALRDAK